ncbi:cytochrome P450, partial [Cercophora samala]
MGLVLGSAHYLLAAVAFALLVRAILGKKAIRRNGEPLRNPPNTLPLVGNGIQFLQPRWNLLSWFDKCQRQFGYETLALTVPTLPPGVLIHDPKNLDYVFKHEGLFTKGNFVKTRSWDLFGNGIINADGDFWKLQRKAGLSFLNTANLRVLTDVALPQYLSESVKELESAKPDQVIDLQDIFHEITTKLMGKMAYNVTPLPFPFLSMEMHFSSPFSSSFDHASGCTAQRFQNPLYPLTEFFFGHKFRKSVSVVKKFGLEIVSRAMEEDAKKAAPVSASSSSPSEPPPPSTEQLDSISGSLIHSLLSAIPDSPETVADAALTYLSAGRDTTGQALTWTFYLLLSHPEVLAKIREEVASVLAQQPPNTGFSPTLFTPRVAPYALAVFYEALRLFPPIPFEIRQCQAPTTLPDGTFLPRDSVLVWCLWAMQRSRLTWGEEAGEFRPGRWLDGGGRMVMRGAGEFPVFYGGARSCLGRRMAEGIAVQVVPTVGWLFDFERGWGGGGERRSGSSLTLPMEGGLPVFVRRREVG